MAQLLLLAAPLWVLALRQAAPDLLGLVEVAPDLLVAAVVAAAWTRSPLAAAAFAAVSGCLLDAPSGGPFGLTGARLALVAVVVAGLREQVALEVPGARLALLAGAALAERAAAALTLAAWAPEVDLLPLLDRGWRIALATTAAGPLAFALADLLHAEAGDGR